MADLQDGESVEMAGYDRQIRPHRRQGPNQDENLRRQCRRQKEADKLIEE